MNTVTCKSFTNLRKLLHVSPLRCPRVELSQSDGRTDEQTEMTKLIVALRNFTEGKGKGKALQ